MGFWIGIVIGLALGNCIGILITSLCVAAKNNDSENEL